MRSKVCGIDRKRLILVFEIEIFLQIAGVDRIAGWPVAAILLDFEIPPPFLDRVQAAVTNNVVEFRQHRRGARHVHRRPAKRLFGKKSLKVPGAGFHAPPAHCSARCGDPVGCAFLAVGFPDLIAVEHELGSGGDRT